MSSTDPPSQVHLVDGAGACDEAKLRAFGEETGLAAAGRAYGVVAVMGPQSSGKSTLLNALYGTRFEEMDALAGRGQTTRGVWLARGSGTGGGAEGVLPLVMDLEGTDGRERGEDEAQFEAQTALFALACSDVLLVNMWTHDVGREHGAGKPLLRAVLQAHARLFGPRRSRLLFVLRDKTRTPLERLETILRADLAAIWEGVTKPEERREATLADYFDVRVTALASLEHDEAGFEADVGALRVQLDGYLGEAAQREDAHVPGDAFALSTKALWDQVAANDDLNLPAHKVMVATVRCTEIASQRLAALQADEAVAQLAARAMQAAVPEFGQKLAAAVGTALEAYDEEARYYDAGVATTARDKLRADAFGAFARAHGAQLRFAAAAAEAALAQDLKDADDAGFAASAAAAVASCLEAFTESAKAAEPEDSEWEHTEAYRLLVDATKARVTAATAALVDRAVTASRGAVREALEPNVASLLEDIPDDLWARVREAVAAAAADARGVLRAKLDGSGVDEAAMAEAEVAIGAHARDLAEELVRRASKSAAALMRDRFATAFHRDARGLPRAWGASEDVVAIAEAARLSAAKALAIIALLRLDEDAVGAAHEAAVSEASVELARGESGACSALSWDGVDASVVLLPPAACRQAWRRFDADAVAQVSQAMAAQEARRSAQGVPSWAILAMIVLGWNELWALLSSPVLLVVLGVLAFVGSKLWIELDASAKLQKGLVPGIIVLAGEVGPALTKLLSEWPQALADNNTKGGQAVAAAAGNATGVGGAAAKAKVEVPQEEVEGEAEGSGFAGGGSSEAGVRRRPKRAD